YSPALKFDARDVENVMKQIVQPTVRNTGFRGFLYVALMITSEGPKVIEFNSRLGDPETQVILPRLESDLLEPLSVISNMTSNAGLLDVDLKWSKNWFCTVVMCSKGYPSSPKIGDEIKGLDRAAAMSDTMIFHSGSIRKDGVLRTNSGRVLCVTSGGKTLAESSSRAYTAVDLITWNGEHHRHDIGLKILDDGAVA
ncbi:MAG: phosphoribosylamine--glycine ligase, partial [Nitrososphaerota archaeon]|nr:phosphoribosylamine--glycine ligase [Nitrososphaerota archaeon]